MHADKVGPAVMSPPTSAPPADPPISPFLSLPDAKRARVHQYVAPPQVPYGYPQVFRSRPVPVVYSRPYAIAEPVMYRSARAIAEARRPAYATGRRPVAVFRAPKAATTSAPAPQTVPGGAILMSPVAASTAWRIPAPIATFFTDIAAQWTQATSALARIPAALRSRAAHYKVVAQRIRVVIAAGSAIALAMLGFGGVVSMTADSVVPPDQVVVVEDGGGDLLVTEPLTGGGFDEPAAEPGDQEADSGEPGADTHDPESGPGTDAHGTSSDSPDSSDGPASSGDSNADDGYTPSENLPVENQEPPPPSEYQPPDSGYVESSPQESPPQYYGEPEYQPYNEPEPEPEPEITYILPQDDYQDPYGNADPLDFGDNYEVIDTYVDDGQPGFVEGSPPAGDTYVDDGQPGFVEGSQPAGG